MANDIGNTNESKVSQMGVWKSTEMLQCLSATIFSIFLFTHYRVVALSHCQKNSRTLNTITNDHKRTTSA